ncbi:hypothetical protein ACSDR0_12515 [Streptosporangium sp. G11]|uniref:hypothetical protein n=1 Tax=Streptosporangium sp. G11 TaxID=3436926 RepID=UPI003EBF0ADD
MSTVRAGVVAVLIGIAALGAVQHPKSGNERSTGWGAKRHAHSTPKHAGGWTTRNWGNGGRTAERSKTTIERRGNWGFGRPRHSDGGRYRAREAGRRDPERGRYGNRGFWRRDPGNERGAEWRYGRHRDREFGRPGSDVRSGDGWDHERLEDPAFERYRGGGSGERGDGWGLGRSRDRQVGLPEDSGFGRYEEDYEAGRERGERLGLGPHMDRE